MMNRGERSQPDKGYLNPIAIYLSSFPLDIYPEGRLLNHTIVLFTIFWPTQYLLCKGTQLNSKKQNKTKQKAQKFKNRQRT